MLNLSLTQQIVLQNEDDGQFKVACRAPGIPQTCAWQTVGWAEPGCV